MLVFLKRALFFKSLLIFVIPTISATPFENQFNQYSPNKIDSFKVFGERCTGTNFLYYLIHYNFPNLATVPPSEFGHKHFLWWLGEPITPQRLKRLNYNEKAIHFSDSDHCLFLVIVRNPYDWLRSFFLLPHCVAPSLTNKGFFYFIKSPWKLVTEYPPSEGQYDEVDNLNPWTKKPFKNVLELRKYKNLNYIKLGSVVKNFLLVRYEDVRDNPKAFVDFVAEQYKLEKKGQFVPVDTFKGTETPYVKKTYFAIRPLELQFINQEIDWETEKLLGYSIKSQVD